MIRPLHRRRDHAHTDGSGKTVLLTGASSGIGRACALALARRGFTVYAGVRTEHAADALRASLPPAAGDGQEAPVAVRGRIIPVFLDVTRRPELDDVAGRIARDHGRLYALVNNAGIAAGGPLELLAADAFRAEFEVNVAGLLATTQVMLPLLRAGRGRLVNMSSTSGRLAAPLAGGYSATKFAVEALSDVLRLELRPWALPVVVVRPGIIRTPMWEKGRRRLREQLAETAAAGPDPRRYVPLMRGGLAYMEQMKPSEPEAVARTVVRALLARKPRPVYAVGANATSELLAARLPARLRDWLVWKIFPLAPEAEDDAEASGRTTKPASYVSLPP